MDKLEPILRHKFWILVTLVLPLAIYGYFSANGAIKADTLKREEDLGKVLGSVPGGNDISQAYSDELKKINEAYAKAIDAEILRLWQSQQSRMIWPAVVAKDVPKQFLGNIPIKSTSVYKSQEYERVLEKLIDSVEPVVSKVDQKIWEDRPQKVWLSGWIPESYLGPPQAAPTSQEVWDAQMDVWFTQLVFDAIRTMNDGKDSITESIVRRIDKIQLVGGDGTPVLGGGGGAASSGGDSSDMYAESSMMLSGPGGYPGASGAGGAGGSGVTSKIDFSPAQEFGSDADGSTATESSSSDYASGFGGMTAANTPRLRYIAETEEAPYLERGFYLSVIMMEKKVPDFIIQLANAPWPIRIVRFHIGPNPYAQTTPSGGSGFPFGGGAMALSGDTEAMMSQLPSDYPGAGAEMSASPFGSEGAFGAGGMGSFGGAAASANAFSTKLKDRYQKGLPDFTQQAMNHSDLIQLHLCGVITFYKQPPAEAEEAAGETGAAVDEALPVMTPEEAAAQKAENEAAAKAAADAAKAAAEGTPPTDPATPGDPAAPTDPATENPPAADPAATSPDPAASTPATPENPADPANPGPATENSPATGTPVPEAASNN